MDEVRLLVDDGRRLRQAARVLCLLVGLIAAAVLVAGWGFGSVSVRQIHPSFAAMAPSTATCFFLAAFALVWMSLGPQPAQRNVIVGVCLFIALIAAADLAVIVFGAANGIDRFIRPDVAAFKTVSMATATATCFLLLAASLDRLARDRTGLPFVSAATAGLVLSSVAVTGYAFDSSALYEVSLFTAMALHTAIAFVFLFASVLMLRPGAGWMSILTGEGGGSASARRLLPGAIVVPFTLCLVALIFTEAALFNANFRLSVLAIAMMVMLSAAVLYFANVQNGIERDLRAALADRDVLIREVYHRVKNNLQMTTALLITGANRVADADAKELLHSTTKRIEALGTVHRLLIASRMPSKVSAPVFLKELCENIFSGQSGAGDSVALDLQADSMTIHIDLAVSLGLIVNELVTNALKHAFNGRESGVVTVRFRAHGGRAVVLTVADNGAGAKNLFEDEEGGGAGARIVQGLVRQLGATMSVASDEGTVVIINIPIGAQEGNRDD